MSLQNVAPAINGSCPICCADIIPDAPVEQSEVLCCPECQSMLVVDGFEGPNLMLSEGPAIEEDWGE